MIKLEKKKENACVKPRGGRVDVLMYVVLSESCTSDYRNRQIDILYKT